MKEKIILYGLRATPIQVIGVHTTYNYLQFSFASLLLPVTVSKVEVYEFKSDVTDPK